MKLYKVIMKVTVESLVKLRNKQLLIVELISPLWHNNKTSIWKYEEQVPNWRTNNNVFEVFSFH